ncbi:MAG: exodeoxyribonuclease VII small subunit [Oscillospiraceae bacterium]|nr:exodeoxyribonuclease VII small subunit [Oscillospiraceae bacterium]
MATVKKSKKLSFEEAVTELEATVAKLEQDDISLDESISLFTRGVELTGLCNGILNEIEGRIVKLVEGGEKEVREEPL